ncbi:MAG: archease [Deltaproteobacteria bacterium]|nr:archease [Deltaproteobacteria bacterium]
MAKKTSYRFIDHTADLGIVVRGEDPKSLFKNTALALFDIIADSKAPGPQEKKILNITGDDWADLMVNWLREVLYLWNGEEYLVKDATVIELSEKSLRAEVALEAYQPQIHTVKTEVKAVTYHQAYVGPANGEWEARIIFDT